MEILLMTDFRQFWACLGTRDVNIENHVITNALSLIVLPVKNVFSSRSHSLKHSSADCY